MADDLRFQKKCYYASAEYAESWWGKFGFIYEGDGSLRLGPDRLSLEGDTHAFSIPFAAIKSVGLGRFSTWSKPLGLSRLTVRFDRDGELRTAYLVPYESAFAPTWRTSALVQSWYETLGGVDKLAGRIEPPDSDPPLAPTLGAWAMLFALAVLVPLGVAATVWALFHI